MEVLAMCTICFQYEMYKDLQDMKRMIQSARRESYPIPEEHLQELEHLVHTLEKQKSKQEEDRSWEDYMHQIHKEDQQKWIYWEEDE